MAMYHVGDSVSQWYVGGRKDHWFAYKGKPTVGTQPDAGPFRTRASAIKWVTEYA